MRNWKSLTAAYLRDPANADVVADLRERVLRSREQRASALLLRIDDPQITALRLKEFTNGQRDAGEDIGRSGNPNLIVKLAPAVFREESARIEKTGDGDEVLRTTPLSVRAAYVIREIILNSSLFSPPVKAWAQRLFPIGSDNLQEYRQEIRTWIALNKRGLESGNYAKIGSPR
jgi:hypothetical protein